MYIITNRALDKNQPGLALFGKVPSEKGPNELRIVRVTPSRNQFKTQIEDNHLTKDEVKALKQKFDLDIDENISQYASLKIACEINAGARKDKKHILLYVHGYNNDMADVMAQSMALEKLYNVIVISFSWPANGGGIDGAAAYISDKKDARASADALNRTIQKIHCYHGLLTAGRLANFKKQAKKEHPDNPAAAREKYDQLLENDCDVTLNLLCHSMGNYLFKYALIPSGGDSRKLVFDTVALVAADTNNENHATWVETISTRHRLYIVINENDFALKWSRRKPGDEQLARLGHYLKNLVARNAYYLNVTDASWVQKSHSYFTGKPVAKNVRMKAMFKAIFEGQTAEKKLLYKPEANYYVLR